MINYLLLIIAVALIIPFIVIGIIVRIIIGKFDNMFARNLAKNIDYVGGTVIFNSDGHTVSAMVWEFQIEWAISTIDWLFNHEPNHCHEAWLHESAYRKQEGIF